MTKARANSRLSLLSHSNSRFSCFASCLFAPFQKPCLMPKLKCCECLMLCRVNQEKNRRCLINDNSGIFFLFQSSQFFIECDCWQKDCVQWRAYCFIAATELQKLSILSILGFLSPFNEKIWCRVRLLNNLRMEHRMFCGQICLFLGFYFILFRKIKCWISLFASRNTGGFFRFEKFQRIFFGFIFKKYKRKL